MKIRKPFVAVIGSGQVGATAAQRILEKNLSDVVLFDIVQGVPQGKALDLMEAAPLEGHEKQVLGTNDYKDIEGAEIVVVTAGLPRKPGMTREDLLAMNAKIIADVCLNIKKFAAHSARSHPKSGAGGGSGRTRGPDGAGLKSFQSQRKRDKRIDPCSGIGQNRTTHTGRRS